MYECRDFTMILPIFLKKINCDFVEVLPRFSCSPNNDQLECGPMPNVMVALPNIGGALCSTPQSLADACCWSAVQ